MYLYLKKHIYTKKNFFLWFLVCNHKTNDSFNMTEASFRLKMKIINLLLIEVHKLNH